MRWAIGGVVFAALAALVVVSQVRMNELHEDKAELRVDLARAEAGKAETDEDNAELEERVERLENSEDFYRALLDETREVADLLEGCVDETDFLHGMMLEPERWYAEEAVAQARTVRAACTSAKAASIRLRTEIAGSA